MIRMATTSNKKLKQVTYRLNLQKIKILKVAITVLYCC